MWALCKTGTSSDISWCNSITGAISLKPGSSYKVIIRPEKTKRMPHPYTSNCTEVYPENLHQRVPPKAKYSSENCMLLCYDSIIVERCGCTLPFMMEGTNSIFTKQNNRHKEGIFSFRTNYGLARRRENKIMHLRWSIDLRCWNKGELEFAWIYRPLSKKLSFGM